MFNVQGRLPLLVTVPNLRVRAACFKLIVETAVFLVSCVNATSKMEQMFNFRDVLGSGTMASLGSRSFLLSVLKNGLQNC